MNAARKLIIEAERNGASFELIGDRLRLVPAPGRKLPDDLILEARAHKRELIAVLSKDMTAKEPDLGLSRFGPIKIKDLTGESTSHDEMDERAAHFEHDAGFPREWADAFAKIVDGPVPGDFDAARWRAIVDGALVFADQWATEAHRLGWTVEEVFGLDKVAPNARLDQRGLAWLLGDGSTVAELDEQGADILTRRGARLRFYRKQALQ